MYRDDQCAVCGEALPPDHFYCREHAAGVDERLHEIGALVERVSHDVPRLTDLLDKVAPETWDWLADRISDDAEPMWPAQPPVDLVVHADEVDVDVDKEPGRVRIRLRTDLRTLLKVLDDGLRGADASRLTAACIGAEGANATH